MQATIRDLDGEDAGSVDLPAVFEETVRPDLIERAVQAAQANRKQDYGADDYAGMRTSAESPGSGRGMAHVPRTNGQGARVPQTVGGRKAHPPKEEKDRSLNINKKERKKAVRSAVAATADADLVAERGHRFDEDLDLPLVVSDDFEELVKTQEVVSFLEAVGVADDIARAEDNKSVRAGQGKLRGRKYKTPKSVLFVTGDEPSRAARNLAGADVATASEVNAEDLAPGAHPGRLTVWTESAIEEVTDR
ncbi:MULTISPECIES: 50S ribosomal protein L4 [Halorussus]|uniref:50S ribosomal protein L4 n=1 Tax=Halorussus TaxID=1070314 RepID=UPI0020A01CC2|nr:50S ribosomal protein L4 [Halorussus vallis]USZ77106.1 50S ribosomal protein L4 [Halorussus vallis]